MWSAVGTPPAPASYEEIGKLALELRKGTDRAIYSIFGGSMYECAQTAFRMDEFFVTIASEPERMEMFLDALLEIHMKNLDEYLTYVAPHVDIIGFSDDLGMQSGPQISTPMFDEFFKYRYKKMWDEVKKRAPHARICMHSCGSIHDLLPSLIDAGLDSVNPVQTTCVNMEPERLKKEFGDKLTFWGGGCDTRNVLPNGTPLQVKENVKRNLDILAPKGGFVFQQVHNILADVPAENIAAMFEAVKEYGTY